MDEQLKKILIQSKDEVSTDFTMKIMDQVYLKKAIQNHKYKPVISPLFFKILTTITLSFILMLVFWIPEDSASAGNYTFITAKVNSTIISIFEIVKENNVYILMILISFIVSMYYILDQFLQKKFHKTQTI